MVLGCVNRTAWGTKLLLTAVWASLVDYVYQFMSLTEGTALPFGSEWVLYPAFSSPSAPNAHPTLLPPAPTPLPPPIESIHDITGAEKNCIKNQQLLNSY